MIEFQIIQLDMILNILIKCLIYPSLFHCEVAQYIAEITFIYSILEPKKVSAYSSI